MECTDLDANDFTDDEDLMGGGNPGSNPTTGSSLGNGGSSGPSGNGPANGVGNSGTSGNIGGSGGGNQGGGATIPQHAWDMLSYLKSHNWTPPNGYKGGKSFANDGRDGGQHLPECYGPFYEYDVWPKVAGQDRGTERIVRGNGAVWYTNDHYKTFFQME